MAGASAERVHLNEFISGRKRLKDYQALVIPGGFSYGDDIAAGKVLANQLLYRLENDLRELVHRRKPILGICNGFQVLVKAGLLPGQPPGQQATLTWNDSARFEDRWVYLKVETEVCPFVKNLPEIIRLPVAHAEGKFLPANKKVLGFLERKKLVVFRYVSPSGELTGYPYNPNGSVAGIAGICSPDGLILGMMPHPERAVIRQHYPDWLRHPESSATAATAGFQIFKNMVDYLA